ncbi:MAG: tRNA (adenosine(37)-N6)-threonylcarbamoyltransferase complex dimerization subunit type 1 TsaB [Thermoguttaceae bacterium]
MRILALETTELIGSVAAMDGCNLLAQLELCRRQRMAQSLAPGVRQLLSQVGWKPRDVELVAATSGPGSFTGLRIGITTAKAFAYAVSADVLGIDTLETIAAGAPDQIRALTAVVDAQRGEVVAGAFQRDTQGWFRPTSAAELVDVDTWLESLPGGTLITGPVLHKLSDRVPDGVTMLDASYRIPKAATVARLAARDYAAGRRDDLFALAPRYSRRSAAEEKLERK